MCEVLSEFPKYVLPLPCNICINVTSWDGLINILQITAAVGQSHPSACMCQSEKGDTLNTELYSSLA